MQKYIAVVNPKMDEDEISSLITKGVAGALFSISHQDYATAARLVGQIKDLSHKYNKPVSIIQDVSDMSDPLDLHFGKRLGVHWLATDKPEHVKMARGLDKLAKIIYKDRTLPKGIKVDSVMSENFLDPDASVLGSNSTSIKHLTTDHVNQNLIDSLLELAAGADSVAIIVSDLDLARSLSFRRPTKKIIFAPKNSDQAGQGAIYWGVHPVFAGKDLFANLQSSKIVAKGDRVADASNIKHVEIQTVT